MNVETMCSELLPAVKDKLTEDLLPQLLQYADWHKHPVSAREDLAVWYKSLKRQDAEAIDATQLARMLALVRCIQFGATCVSHCSDADASYDMSDLEWSGNGVALLAIATRKNLRILIMGVLGEAGLELLCEDRRADENFVAQVKELVRRRLTQIH